MNEKKGNICPNCDPELYVIYGYCLLCGKMGEPPLPTRKPKNLKEFEEYLELCEGWNREKVSNLSNDNFKHNYAVNPGLF